MDYKKIKKDNYTLHLINTDRFKKVKIMIRFTKLYDFEECAYLRLLSKVLSFNGTKKYKSTSEISKRFEYLYGTSFSVGVFSGSKNMTFEVSTSLVNPKYVDDHLYEDVFDVMGQILKEPIIKNSMFNEENFDLEKDNLIKSILNTKDNPDSYGSLLFDELFFQNTNYALSAYRNIDVYKNIDNKKMYKVYLDLFKKYKIDVLVLGDIDEDKVTYLLDDLLDGFKESSDYSKDLYIKTNPKRGEYKEEYNTNQSNLYIGLSLGKLTKEERDYALYLYNTILGSMNNSVLFVKVREDNSLCYYVRSTINRFTDTIIVSSGINKKNYNKALEVIKESIESMKDIKTIKPLMKNAKKTIDIALNDYYDSSKKIINYYYNNEFYDSDEVEIRRSKIRALNEEDVINIANKVKIETVFLLEGSVNEED